jgi:hypothetical protein
MREALDPVFDEIPLGYRNLVEIAKRRRKDQFPRGPEPRAQSMHIAAWIRQHPL